MHLLTDSLLIFFATVLALGWIIWLSARSTSIPGLDKDTGVQKVHARATSRLGGLGVMLGLACGLAVTHSVGFLRDINQELVSSSSFKGIYAPLLVCALPVFLGGLLEDLTHQISPKVRFVLGLVSASAAWIVLGVQVTRTGVWSIDELLAFTVVSYLVTMLVVVGFTHAMNIIDGFHGLAGSQVAFMCLGMSILCWHDGQVELMTLSFTMLVVSLGFLCWNWPRGTIFLGDAGAYLLGFWVVSVGLLWVQKDALVSPMAPVLMGAYPLIETIWSMYRRLRSRDKWVASPDGLHLHSLIYRRLCWMPSPMDVEADAELRLALMNSRNAMVTPLFCLCFLSFDAFVLVFYQDTNALLLGLLLFVVGYLWLFKRLVQFRTPSVFRILSQLSKDSAKSKALKTTNRLAKL